MSQGEVNARWHEKAGQEGCLQDPRSPLCEELSSGHLLIPPPYLAFMRSYMLDSMYSKIMYRVLFSRTSSRNRTMFG